MKQHIVTLITGHQGLGDHILCNGIYRQSSYTSRICIIPVKRNYVKQVRRMLSDLKNVIIFPIPMRRNWSWLRIFQIFGNIICINQVRLGTLGHNFLLEGIRYDNNFYLQANLDFSQRWVEIPRSLSLESKAYEEFGCSEEPYIFLHEDRARNYLIDRNFLPPGIRVVSPNVDLAHKYSIFDYRSVISSAQEIHCIESSFAAFIETLNLQSVRKYAHRYSRGNALYDYRFEFTYKSDWKILNSKTP